MLVNKVTMKYFKRDMRKLSSRYFHSVFMKQPNCRVKAKATGKRGLVWHEICGICGEIYVTEDRMVEVDHKEPIGDFPFKKVGPDLYYIDVAWLDKLFCSFTNLQPICKQCHVKKTGDDSQFNIFRGDLL